MGLVPGHAYTLIGCAEYKGAKLVLLRNPVFYIYFYINFISGVQRNGKENGLISKISGLHN